MRDNRGIHRAGNALCRLEGANLCSQRPLTKLGIGRHEPAYGASLKGLSFRAAAVMALSASLYGLSVPAGCAPGPGGEAGPAAPLLHLHPGPAERGALSLSRSPPPTFPDGPGNELLVSSQGRAFRLNFMLVNSKKAWLCARLRLPFRSPRFPKPSPSSWTSLLSRQPSLQPGLVPVLKAALLQAEKLLA